MSDIEEQLIENGQRSNQSERKKLQIQESKWLHAYRLLNIFGLLILIVLNYLSDFNKKDTNILIFIKITLLGLAIAFYIYSFCIFLCLFNYETIFIMSYLSYTLLLILTTVLMSSDISDFIKKETNNTLSFSI